MFHFFVLNSPCVIMICSQKILKISNWNSNNMLEDKLLTKHYLTIMTLNYTLTWTELDMFSIIINNFELEDNLIDVNTMFRCISKLYNLFYNLFLCTLWMRGDLLDHNRILLLSLCRSGSVLDNHVTIFSDLYGR